MGEACSTEPWIIRKGNETAEANNEHLIGKLNFYAWPDLLQNTVLKT